MRFSDSGQARTSQAVQAFSILRHSSDPRLSFLPPDLTFLPITEPLVEIVWLEYSFLRFPCVVHVYRPCFFYLASGIYASFTSVFQLHVCALTPIVLSLILSFEFQNTQHVTANLMTDFDLSH